MSRAWSAVVVVTLVAWCINLPVARGEEPQSELQTAIRALTVAPDSAEATSTWLAIESHLKRLHEQRRKPTDEVAARLFGLALEGKRLAQWRALRALHAIYGNESARFLLQIATGRAVEVSPAADYAPRLEKHAVENESLLTLRALQALYYLHTPLRGERLYYYGTLARKEMPFDGRAHINPFYVALLAELHAMQTGQEDLSRFEKASTDALYAVRERSNPHEWILFYLARLLYFVDERDYNGNADLFLSFARSKGFAGFSSKEPVSRAFNDTTSLDRKLERAITVVTLYARERYDADKTRGWTRVAHRNRTMIVQLVGALANMSPEDPLAALIADLARLQINELEPASSRPRLLSDIVAGLLRKLESSTPAEPSALPTFSQIERNVRGANPVEAALAWSALEAALQSPKFTLSAEAARNIEKLALESRGEESRRALRALYARDTDLRAARLGAEAMDEAFWIAALAEVTSQAPGRAPFSLPAAQRSAPHTAILKMLAQQPASAFDQTEKAALHEGLKDEKKPLPHAVHTLVLSRFTARPNGSLEGWPFRQIHVDSSLARCASRRATRDDERMAAAGCQWQLLGVRNREYKSWAELSYDAILGSTTLDILGPKPHKAEAGHLSITVEPHLNIAPIECTRSEERGTRILNLPKGATLRDPGPIATAFPEVDPTRIGLDRDFQCLRVGGLFDEKLGTCYKTFTDTQKPSDLPGAYVHRLGLKHRTWLARSCKFINPPKEETITLPDGRTVTLRPHMVDTSMRVKVGFKPSPETNWIAVKIPSKDEPNVDCTGCATSSLRPIVEPGGGWQIFSVIGGEVELSFYLAPEAERIADPDRFVGLPSATTNETFLQILELNRENVRHFVSLDLFNLAMAPADGALPTTGAKPVPNQGLLPYVATLQAALFPAQPGIVGSGWLLDDHPDRAELPTLQALIRMKLLSRVAAMNWPGSPTAEAPFDMRKRFLQEALAPVSVRVFEAQAPKLERQILLLGPVRTVVKDTLGKVRTALSSVERLSEDEAYALLGRALDTLEVRNPEAIKSKESLVTSLVGAEKKLSHLLTDVNERLVFGCLALISLQFKGYGPIPALASAENVLNVCGQL